jgi:hypothetical protein
MYINLDGSFNTPSGSLKLKKTKSQCKSGNAANENGKKYAFKAVSAAGLVS